MKLNPFSKIKKARETLSLSGGRKPDTHWKVLFGLGVTLLVLAVVSGGFVFWWSAFLVTEETPSQETDRAFSKQNFETVLNYFTDREKRFEDAPDRSYPKDPS